MKKLYFFISISLLILGCKTEKSTKEKQTDSEKIVFQPLVELIDEKLLEIIDPEAKVEIIAEGFDWSEGPLWIDGLGLLFSDIPPNKIYLWTEETGAEVFLNPSGYTGTIQRGGEVGSNGLLLDSEGKLVLCQHGDRRIARMMSSYNDPKPEYETVVGNYQGKKLNSPNDACFSSNGTLYFTDPPYGLEKSMDDPLKELSFQGVYKYSKTGDLTLLTEEMTRPNGIAFSPDEKTLYVANSDPAKAIWMKFMLNEERLIESQGVFHDATSLVGEEAGLPDGLKVDGNGNIFATGPGGVWIFNSEGSVLGKIKTGQATSNCAIGNDGKVLYITADMYVMMVKLKS